MRILVCAFLFLLTCSACSACSAMDGDKPAPVRVGPADPADPVVPVVPVVPVDNAAPVLQPAPGTLANPILASDMPELEAIMSNLPPGCPTEVTARLAVVSVRYLGFDGLVRQGQMVIDRDLADDVTRIFAFILDTGFPLHSVLPVAHPEIQAKAPYGLSPDTDNSSGFACRPSVGSARLSMHGRGWAVDLNPRQNPYIKGHVVLPPHTAYDPAAPGTLTADHPVVLKFKELGWKWGGDWQSLKDYMHFEKVPPGMDQGS